MSVPGIQDHAWARSTPCTHCREDADGQCATCHSPVCADCTQLVNGATRPLVVCTVCVGSGAHNRHRRGLYSVLWLSLSVISVLCAGAIFLAW